MSTTTTPVYTPGIAGDLTSGALGAGADSSFDVDLRSAFEGQLHIVSTPGSSVHATNGLKVEVFRKYGGASPGSPTNGESPCGIGPYVIPSVVSTPASIDIFLGPGFFLVKLTNLDGTNGLDDVSATLDVVSGLLNT